MLDMPLQKAWSLFIAQAASRLGKAVSEEIEIWLCGLKLYFINGCPTGVSAVDRFWTNHSKVWLGI